MKQRYCSLALLIVLISGICAIHAGAQDSEFPGSAPKDVQTQRNNVEDVQNLQIKILQAVQRQVDLLKENLVDITSREEVIRENIEFSESKEQQLIKTHDIISDYRISFQKETTPIIPDCGVVAKILNAAEPPYILQEERTTRTEKAPVLKNGTRESGVSGLEQFFMDTARSGFLELIVPFDKQYEKCFDYKLLGIAKINERNVYVMDVKGKEKTSEKGITEKNIIHADDINKNLVAEAYPGYIGLKPGVEIRGPAATRILPKNEDELVSATMNTSWNIKFGGIALIDAGTMEMFQFNDELVNITTVVRTNIADYMAFNLNSVGKLPNGEPGVLIKYDRMGAPIPKGPEDFNNRGIIREDYISSRAFIVQTEYEKVKIKDQLLTMPVARTVGVFRRSLNPETLEFNGLAYLEEKYKAGYSDYKAFNVDTNIKFGAMEELDE